MPSRSRSRSQSASPGRLTAPRAYAYPPRVLRITYRSNYHPRRVAVAYAKVPYGGVFDLTEVLTRAVTTSEIIWYRLDRLLPAQITPIIRRELVRWPEALRKTSKSTHVSWRA